MKNNVKTNIFFGAKLFCSNGSETYAKYIVCDPINLDKNTNNFLRAHSFDLMTTITHMLFYKHLIDKEDVTSEGGKIFLAMWNAIDDNCLCNQVNSNPIDCEDISITQDMNCYFLEVYK